MQNETTCDGRSLVARTAALKRAREKLAPIRKTASQISKWILGPFFSCRYAVGILLCPAAGLESCRNTGLDRTFQPRRGIIAAVNSDDSSTTENDEIASLRGGGEQAVADLFSKYRPQLERMVEFRLDRRVYGRVDSADILQEAYLEVARRIDDYLKQPQVSFFVWARQITWQTLLTTHRLNFQVQKRDATQEVSLHGVARGNATSVSLASMLAGNMTSPSHAAIRDERTVQLRNALDTMDEMDREVLALRHFEHLTNKEVAEVLGIQKTAASNRYVRALERLREILDEVMGDSK